MRRMLLIGILVAAGLAAVLASGAEGGGGPTDSYLVRAYFDNAGFLVKDEEVRVAGATVGTIDSVDVTTPGEPVFRNGKDAPGKAVVVLNITDPGFQDWRQDASCIIRPQSLLGEKYVDCKPTQPRSAASKPPPELSTIPDGEPGAGERFLPINNNGKAVDIDLVNNINRQPQADKFRLILNDLGAGLAARGKTLQQVIYRADPALKETDKVLAILAKQNRGLAQLAVDSDAILQPLARERDHIAGFINNATTAGQAAAERAQDIERGFQDFPPALQQLQPTMVQLRRFAEAATPVAADLRTGAPYLTKITKLLGPFAKAGTPALTTLGRATQQSLPDLLDSRGLINDLGTLGSKTTPGAKALKKVLVTLRKTDGRDELYKAILNLGSTVNGFDSYGHYLRAAIQINNCLDISAVVVPGCLAKWTHLPHSSASSAGASALTQPSTEAAVNANPKTAKDLLPSPIAGQLDAATDQKAQKQNAGQLGKHQQQAAKDLLGYLTGNGR